jgi:acyl carrier protein
MTKDELKAVMFEELSNIAPEAEPAAIDLDAELREELDIDSMDFLNLVIALHKRLGVEIPEADYAKLASINAAVDYLAARAGG